MSRIPKRAKLLVVDDEPNQRELLVDLLERDGHQVVALASGGQAAARLRAGQECDLLLTDQRMPDLDGLALLDLVRAERPDLPVVLMTAYGTVSTAVAAMKRGAADYLTKPFDRDELQLVVGRVLHRRHLEHEVASLRAALRGSHRLCGIVGRSASMQEVFALLERVAPSEASVLVGGESGTGKELVARALHALSHRSGGPFVALNCAAVPESLLESEFFGHERGAFTGANQARPGRFEQADGGTLFLDEIGALRVDLQAKLLRAVQEREVQRLGGLAPRPVQVRLVAATSEDLEVAIRERRFREDLFYRLNVVGIELPPLRDRPVDIPLLVEHFAERAAQRLGREPLAPEPGVLDLLAQHAWPGNVRELENCVERMVVLASGERLQARDLPATVRAPSGEDSPGPVLLPPEGLSLESLERSLMTQALRRSRGALRPAAAMLGISYKTLQYRLRKFGIQRESFAPEGGADGGG